MPFQCVLPLLNQLWSKIFRSSVLLHCILVGPCFSSTHSALDLLSPKPTSSLQVVRISCRHSFAVNPWISSHCYAIVYCSGCPTYARSSASVQAVSQLLLSCQLITKFFSKCLTSEYLISHCLHGFVHRKYVSTIGVDWLLAWPIESDIQNLLIFFFLTIIGISVFWLQIK